MTAFPLFAKVREVSLPETGEVVRALVPDNALSVETLAKVRIGRVVHVVTETARNYDQLKLLWALAEKIHQNSERFTSRDHVVREIKLNTGHVEREQLNIAGLGVVERTWPASIAYESLTQDEWAVWLDKALAYVRSDIWPGMPEGVLKDEINSMLGDDTLWPEAKARRRTDAPAKREVA